MRREGTILTSLSARLLVSDAQAQRLFAAGHDALALRAIALRQLAAGSEPSEIETVLRTRSPWSRRWLRAIITDATMLRSSTIEKAKSDLIGMDERLARLQRRAINHADTGKRAMLYERLDRQRASKTALEAIAAGQVSACFGSRKHARARHTCNSPEQLTAWRAKWDMSRHGNLFMPGERDRRLGNPAFQFDALTRSLKINLPGEHGSFTVPVQSNDPRLDRLLIGYDGPVTARVRYSTRKGHWYVDLTIRERVLPTLTSRARGAVGVDLNVDHWAVCRTTADGNPVEWRKIGISMGVSAHETRQRAAQAANEIVQLALLHGVPIVAERLNFGRARMNLRYLGPARARQLSSFAYSAYLTALVRAARRAGVEVILVHPAYSSLLGQANYASPYGVSVDLAAACVLARRGLGLRERVRPQVARHLAPVEAKMGSRMSSIRSLSQALPPRRQTWSTSQLRRSPLSTRRGASLGRAPTGSMDLAIHLNEGSQTLGYAASTRNTAANATTTHDRECHE